MELTKGAQA